jgi:hypothetical protein
MLLTRNAVWLWITALTLGSALAIASPASATVRTASFSWSPATGPVWGYQIYLSVDGGAESLYGHVNQPRALIQVDSGASLIVRVAAIDAAGRSGPRSDPSQSLRLCPGDFDGDEVVALSDIRRSHLCVLQAATGPCAGADLDDDGFVAIDDFTKLELGADACPSPAPDTCAGDMDGDGWISSADVVRMKVCIGLRPVGNCIPADFDGDGWVDNGDVLGANRAAGACAH